MKNRIEQKKNLTFVDLFSGIGGFRIALENMGCECLGFSEIESQAIKVYKKNFDVSQEIEIGDITKAKKLPYADILVGGVPCQSWSIAGKMKGFEDPRGRLWLDTINATKQVNPKVFVYENVKGLADPRNKLNLDLIINEFNNLGYNVYCNIFNAFDYGLPQSRERLFIIGIRKDLDNQSFLIPKKYESLPFLFDILENSIKTNQKESNHIKCTNNFNMAAVVNKGNFYTFSDVRNGDYTIHSWDIVETSQKEKRICMLLLKNRRKFLYGSKDGNPMSSKDIINLASNLTIDQIESDQKFITLADIEGLVKKNILRRVEDKYEFVNSKISSGINGIYRIFLPESHVFSTLTKSGSRDYIAEISMPKDVKDKKAYFIREIYQKKMYRKISIKEASRIQGFPDKFVFETNYSVSLGLLGNAVAVNVVESVVKELFNTIGQKL